MLLRILFFVCSFGLVACVSQSAPQPTDSKNSFQSGAPQIDAEYLLSGRAIFDRSLDKEDLPEQGLLSVSPSMTEFLEELSPGAPLDVRWRELVSRFNRDQFVVEYDAQTTLSAAETFELQTGNCLAVTMLLVSLTREMGIDAYFNQVETPQLRKFEDGQTFVNYRHINMVAEVPYGRKVVDFGLADYDSTMYQYRISDRAAFSQYYSNRAMEVMRAGGDRLYAFKLIRKALQLAPGDSNIWINLGALYKRYALPKAAEQSYQLALQLDPENTMALSSLGRLYRETGNEEMAALFHKRARSLEAAHPHVLYYDAKDSYVNGNYRASLATLNRALDNSTDDHRIHFLLGKTHFQLGKYTAAKKHLTKAFSLINDQNIKSRYEQELSELRQISTL